MTKCSLMLFVGSVIIATNSWCWHVTVQNDTDFVILASCKKAGVVKVNSELIQPKKSAECDCGLADCSTGINIVVYELYKDKDGLMRSKDIELSEKWLIKCGNKSIRVVQQAPGKYKIE